MPWKGTIEKAGLQAQRQYPQEIAEKQIAEEIPLSWRADSILWGYVTKYYLKGSGAGFVVPPYAAYWERIWGATPIEDLPRYKDLYAFTPYIKACIDVTVNLAISNGFELEGGDDAVREWLLDWCDEHNILQTLRVTATDMLVFGGGMFEICGKTEGLEPEEWWLKPLDPVNMRVRRDAYGQVLGYVQLLTMPPAVFTPQEICHIRWGAKSWWYEFNYGISLLRPLLKIQALLDQLENDLAIITHCYTKPMLWVQAGRPEQPFSDTQLNQLMTAFADRGVATDVFTRGDVNVKPLTSLTKDIKVDYWLNYLYKQREAVLGVPKIFLGESEGTNRACYSEDTLVLTEKGWKLHKDVGENEKIAIYDTVSNSIRFEKPLRLYVCDYDGIMYHFTSQGRIDILVTPEHKMLYKTYEAPEWHVDAAENLPKRILFRAIAPIENKEGKTDFILPSVQIKTAHDKILKFKEPKAIKMNDWLEFLGYYLSEGGLSTKWKGKPNYVITFAQRDEKKAKKIRNCLKRCDLSFTEYTDGNLNRWNVYGKQVWTWLKDNCGSHHHEKHVPREFFNLPAEQLRILFEALILGDGTRDKRPNRTSITYYATSKTLAENTQEIALRLGFFAHIKINIDKRDNRKPVFRVQMSSSTIKVCRKIERVNYKGKVYCFSTSTGFYVTSRNGKPAIQGNTADIVMQEFCCRLRMLQQLVGENIETDLFAQLVEAKFGEGKEVPHLAWKPVWEPTLDLKAKYIGELVQLGIILPSEARPQLGYPVEPPQEAIEAAKLLPPPRGPVKGLMAPSSEETEGIPAGD